MSILITGANSGIGQAFAYELAAKGESLILVGRDEARLYQCVQQCLKLGATSAIHIVCDLSQAKARKQLLAHLRDLPIRGIINSAGIGFKSEFNKSDFGKQQQIIDLNISALMHICHALAAPLSQQANSFIINIASTAAFQAGPKMASYYASKAYVLSFTEALHEELKAKGIRVQCLCPGFTESSFFSNSNMSEDKTFASGIMSAERVAKESLNNLHKAVYIPGKRNRVGAVMSKLLPRAMTRKIAGKLQG